MKTNKQNIIRFLQAIFILLMGGLFVFIFTASKVKQGEVICHDIKVDIDSDESDLYFLEESDILKLLTDNGQEIVINQPMAKIDLSAIENRLKQNEFISNAEVYTNFEGLMMVDVEQKKPMYRVINNSGVSYYISESGTKMPLSTKFTPRLLVATGNIPVVDDINEDVINQDLTLLVDFIYADAFWDAMIGQIYVENGGEFVLIPKIEGHTIQLGTIDDVEEKFKKLKLFYEQAIQYTAWEKYKTINLKYEGQIVCTKK
ncbi:MAG: cell division protein FtsQ/DivIB [Chitinophagales bacterium]